MYIDNQKVGRQIAQLRSDDYVFEAFAAEAVIQNMMAGSYVDITV